MEDSRNLEDRLKGLSEAEIIDELDKTGSNLVVAIENLERDFNMGTIVRSANAFGVRDIYIIGRKQWNKRGAMMTYKYLRLHYLATVDEFVSIMNSQSRQIIVLDNIAGSTDMSKTQLSASSVIVFGSESNGVTAELAERADKIVAIEQFGSTRSLNVGVASGIAMYEWTRRFRLNS